jgi:hypothetical protein
MAEAAGPTNQDGIYYQNSLAAQYLAELLSLQPSPPRERVVEVRVEAPAHVDDIVVRYADGHRDWIQAKVNLRASGPAWTGLWEAFSAQMQDQAFGRDDRLVIAMGRRNDLADHLQALIERAATSESEDELKRRLGADLRKTFQAIQDALTPPLSAFRMLRLVELRVMTEGDIETLFTRLELGSATATPTTLLSNLRDLAGGQARVRGTFRAVPFRSKLAQSFGVDLFEPREWGLAAYRGTLLRAARIEVPGKGVSVPVQDLVVWPRVRRRDAAPEQDFDDETPTWDTAERLSGVDLSRFPQPDLSRCILIAGPGMGKSTLVTALVAGLVNTPIVPVEVPLGAFGDNDQSVIEFVEGAVNREFSVRIDWQRLADQGLICVFFDGLDEVPTAKRGKILKKVALFSSRFPDVPWLLTVRDPAALNGPLDGELLELEPFDNPEITELVRRFKPWSEGLEDWAFTRNLEAYPDLARLARIPLFLSIMLAGWTPDAPLPRKRSDVIENYLASLFDPDRHKSHSAPKLSGTALRTVAQALAFSSLEREEIGLSRRQAMQVIPLHTQGSPDAVLGQLLASGVLRETIDRRLQFPYPIVQEYLAAVHLVDVAPEQIASRIGDVVKRPWAQVLQFALELLSDPTPHVQAMMNAPDDVFSTGLRLIGRCVANGTAVGPELREEIGSRLAELWGTASYSNRERVGRLIVDAYSNPLHSEVRRRLGWHWLLQSGAGEIIHRAADPELTSAVVDELLAGRLSMFMSLREIEEPLQAIAAKVAAKVADKARDPGATDDVFDGLVDFLERISIDPSAAAPLRGIIKDTSFPVRLRLAARRAIAEAPDDAVLQEARDGLAHSDWKVQSAASYLFSRCPDRAEAIGAVLTSQKVPNEAKDYLIERMGLVIRGSDERAEVARRILERPNLGDRHADILKVYRIRTGDRQTMLDMVERLDEQSTEIAQAVLVSLNHHPERAIGERALEKVQLRSDPPSEVPEMSGAAVTGLTYRVSSDGWNSYAMEPAPAHPAIDVWSPMFDRWLAVAGLTKIQRLRMLTRLLRIRPELIEEIRAIVLSAKDPDDPEWDEDDGGHHLRHGLDDLRRMGVEVPLDLAETFVLAKRPNLPYAGLAVLSAQATRESLDRLLALYRRVKGDRRTSTLDAIEVVASRLNVAITRSDLQ